MMMTMNTALDYDSNIDTILRLPERTGATIIAEQCREAGLAFVQDAERWGKAELAMWLMGPYAVLTKYVSLEARTRTGEPARGAPLLREIDARMVERLVKTARAEVLDVLRRAADPEGGASFAFSMLAAGFVVRCEDRGRNAGWIPTADARRLADRVLSLFAADYLARPADYESDLSVCAHCGAVDFDAIAKARGICHRHGSGLFVPKARHSTIPYLPEGA